MKRKGFTLIELLMVVAIIGIITSIAVPNFFIAHNRAKQRATAAEMNSYGKCISTYQIDAQGNVPDCDGDIFCLYSSLVPAYSGTLTRVDQWGNTFLYSNFGAVIGDGGRISYELRSCGADGLPGAMLEKDSPITAFELDIVLRDGSFISWIK